MLNTLPHKGRPPCPFIIKASLRVWNLCGDCQLGYLSSLSSLFSHMACDLPGSLHMDPALQQDSLDFLRAWQGNSKRQHSKTWSTDVVPVLMKPLLVSHMLIFHWAKQVTWSTLACNAGGDSQGLEYRRPGSLRTASVTATTWGYVPLGVEGQVEPSAVGCIRQGP